MLTVATLELDDYTIAWVCALPLEAAAARAMLEKIHSPPQQITDPNAYEFGELNGHHIVIAYLPNGAYGTVSAAAVVSRMCLTFPRLQFGLMVGIGGGVPSKRNNIRLGDIVVSKPGGKHGGVIQYDYGKAVQGGQFEPTGILNQPPQVLLTHMSQLEAKQITGGEDSISKIVGAVLEQNPNMVERFSAPGQHTDFLFDSSYRHADKDSDCEKCDKERLVKRQPRDTRTPYIHYGLIASGDQVMKDSETRDRLARQHGILCFEMEAAGLMNELPTLVIRGICDYCDSHKQKQWQGYAALTAAAYTKLLLSAIPVCRASPSLLENKPRHWVVSLPRNPKFVGRQDEMRKLEELLTMRDGPRRVAITGLGGVGKTQVALEVAYRIRDRDKECSVLWVPCTSHALIEQTFLRFAEILGLQGVKPADVKEQIKTYLSSERAGKWLLVFDNADDTEMWLSANDTAPALEDFLPQSEQGYILFTTRNRKLAMKLAPFNIIPIPDVDKGTAFQILEKFLEHKNLPKDDTTATALLEQLAFLPLAITQASAYIIENDIGLSDYLALLQEQEEVAVELLSEDFRDPGRYKDIRNPVITTWLISFNQIQHQNQVAAEYLSFMACISPRNIPQSLLPSHSTKKQTLDALGLLNAYSFTNNQATDISMHRLVHIATRNWLKKKELFSYWIQKVACQIQEVFPDYHHTKRKLWRKYLPHALALIREDDFIKKEKRHTGLIQKIADCLTSDGRFHEAEALYKQLLEIDQHRNGPEHPDTLTSMANLASTYRKQGRWHEAEKLDVEVLEMRKALLGAEHPGTLTSMANLAYT
jgi:nucleoside phosphorylase/tetratricopeptide (TPR) repeat protein